MTQAAVNNAIVLYRLSVSREDVEKTEELFFTTPLLQKVLDNPVILQRQKETVINKLFSKAQLPAKIADFINMMCRLGYCASMGDIFQAYYQYWDEQNQILRAELVDATSPTSEEIKEVEDILRTRYPDKQLDLTVKVDEALIGGYIIRVRHKEYDRSFEGRLRQMERKLTGR